MTIELTSPTPSTAADKAAALTYLKSNYNWPKSIQFENLDKLLERVVQFLKNHQHGPQPVLYIAGSLPPALVEYPKGYRKFREV